MSLQEAASSGSFDPRAAQPSDQRQAESPFSPALDEAVDPVMAEPASPFGNPYDLSTTPEEAFAEGGEPDKRTTRRRAWTVVGLAIIIPAAIAAVIGWQLFSSDADPAASVTRVTTTVGSGAAVTQEAVADAERPVVTTIAASTDTGGSASATTVASAVPATVDTDESAATTSATATVGTEAQTDLSSLEPAERLAAWPEIVTIQVLPGETLWLIAQNFGTTISAIVTLNGLADPELLSVGQDLLIPVDFAEEIVEAPAVVASETAVAETDSVAVGTSDGAEASIGVPTLTDDLINWQTVASIAIEEGDSLESIALANDTTIEAIMALNGLANAHLIFTGDVIRVPVGYPNNPSVGSLAEPQVQQVQLEEPSGTETIVSEPAEGEDMLEEEFPTGSPPADDDDDYMLEE